MAATMDGSVQVPLQHLQKSGGFSLDRGSSLLKLVYVPKDAKEAEGKSPGLGALKLATFPVTELDKAVYFINQNCLMKGSSDAPIYTTGMGSGEKVKDLDKRLKIRLVDLPKWECFAKGFAYMSRHFDATVYLEKGSADHRYEAEVKSFTSFFGGFSEGGQYKFDLHYDALNALPADMYQKSPLIQKSTRVSAFPCLLVMAGSRNIFMRVDENGDHNILDVSNGYSTPFSVLGSFLAGSKKFQELNTLTEEGDQSQVNIGWCDYKTDSSSKDDLYSKIAEEDELKDALFCFGKAPGKTTDDFQGGDMAQALLNVFAIDVTRHAVGVALSAGISEVVFCGSLVSTKIARELLANNFMKHKVYRIGHLTKGQQLNMHFLRHSSHVGALGALISNIGE